MIEKLQQQKYKKLYKKIFFVLAFIITIQGTYYLAEAEKNTYLGISAEQRRTYDRTLLRAGTPKELLASLSDYQKKFILENLKDGAVYNTSNSDIIEPNGSETKRMPDMRLSVIIYSFHENGEQQYQLFPSFQWLGNGYTIENDIFKFELGNDLEATSTWKTEEDSPVKMTAYFTRSNGKQNSIGTIGPCQSIFSYGNGKESGYIFQMPDGCNKKSDGYYGACAVFYAKSAKETLDSIMAMNYCHNKNSLLHSSSQYYFTTFNVK